MNNKELMEYEVDFIYGVLSKTFPLLVEQRLTGEDLNAATKSIVTALSESLISLRVSSSS